MYCVARIIEPSYKVVEISPLFECVCVDEFVGRFFSFVLIRVNSLFVFINYVSAACTFFTALVDTCLLPPCLSFNVTSIHSMI